MEISQYWTPSERFTVIKVLAKKIQEQTDDNEYLKDDEPIISDNAYFIELVASQTSLILEDKRDFILGRVFGCG